MRYVACFHLGACDRWKKATREDIAFSLFVATLICSSAGYFLTRTGVRGSPVKSQAELPGRSSPLLLVRLFHRLAPRLELRDEVWEVPSQHPPPCLQQRVRGDLSAKEPLPGKARRDGCACHLLIVAKPTLEGNLAWARSRRRGFLHGEAEAP